jgi:aspartyl-tRNA(Asn)/glutamyl-tRNA(Gln) amidotransferase subunit B
VYFRDMIPDQYEAVIGLEVHVQLLTNSKLFCGDAAAFGAAPNTHISPITLAHPGTLPRINRAAINYALRLGIALGCEITTYNYFARKNYFYPDLPKGYQVSQHTTPICRNGTVAIVADGQSRTIPLNRIHMEEDAGKSLHDITANYTCIDLNRAGVPLLEIVTEPALHSAEEAFAFVTELRRLVRWLGICDGNMEEGSMRCDANVSIRRKGETRLGTKVEVKNLNSIRNVKRAITHELSRLVTLTESGGTIVQETRSFDAEAGTTFSMRTKEEADDYRYFPEPDLTPFVLTAAYLDAVKATIGVLPAMAETRYRELGLSATDAAQLCQEKEVMQYYDAVIAATTAYKAAANWMLGPVRSYLNDNGISITAFPLPPTGLAALTDWVESGKTNFSTASSRIFPVLVNDPAQTTEQVALSLDLVQESDATAIVQWVEEVLMAMPDKVSEYRKGKKGLLGLFVGEVKKKSKGKADIKMVNTLLEQKLNT